MRAFDKISPEEFPHYDPAGSIKAFQQITDAVVAAPDADAIRDILKEPAIPKRIREDGYDHMRAIDGILQQLGLSLHTFWCDDAAAFESRVTALLRRSERRYYVTMPDDHFPYEVPPELSGTGKQIIVHDRVSNTRRFELQEFEGPRPMLALNNDEGSKLFAATWFMWGHLRTRGWALRDGGHRRWRNLRDAASDMKWSGTVLEWLVFLNILFGPYMSESFGEKTKAAVKWYRSHSTFRCAAFQYMYPFICADKGTNHDSDYGSVSHQEQTYNRFFDDEAFRVKGKRVQMRSFWLWVDEMLTRLLPNLHTLLLAFFIVGLRDGFWSKGKLPLFVGLSCCHQC